MSFDDATNGGGSSGSHPLAPHTAPLERALEALRGATYAHRIPLDEDTFHSPRWADILGLRPADLPPHGSFLEWLFERTHPEDRVGLETAYQDFVSGRSPTYDVRIRLRHRSGDWVWVRGVSAPVERTEDGRIRALVGLMVDVSHDEAAVRSVRTVGDRVHRALVSGAAAVCRHDRDLHPVWSCDPAAGSPGEAPVGSRERDLLDPDAMARLDALKRSVLEGGPPASMRARTGTDDSTRWWDIGVSPDRADGEVTGVVTVAVDVTELRAAEAAARSAESEVEAALEAKDAVVEGLLGAVRPPGRGAPPRPDLLPELAEGLRRRVTPLTRRWHRTLQQRLSTRPRRVFPGDDLLDGMPGVVYWLADSLANGHEPDPVSIESLRELAAHWRDGGYAVEEALLHVRLLGEILHGALRDLVADVAEDAPAVSVARASERLCHGINMAQVVLVASYRDAEDQRFSDFGSALAHEVRDHLGAALGAIQLSRMLEEDGSDVAMEKRAPLLGRAEAALRKANERVSSVQALSRTGIASPEAWDRVGLADVAREVVDDVRSRLGADVRVEVAELPDVAVPRDPVSLVLHNLVENAVKYADPAKPERWVRLHGDVRPDGHLIVHVGDNGLGIPEAEQERIFARFQRGRHARSEGFGLGLAIARQAAHQVGGSLLLESEPGGGSTFSFALPSESLEGGAAD